jgi:hypothetical protein
MTTHSTLKKLQAMNEELKKVQLTIELRKVIGPVFYDIYDTPLQTKINFNEKITATSEFGNTKIKGALTADVIELDITNKGSFKLNKEPPFKNDFIVIPIYNESRRLINNYLRIIIKAVNMENNLILKKEIYNWVYNVGNITLGTVEFELPFDDFNTSNITLNQSFRYFPISTTTGVFDHYRAGYVKIDYNSEGLSTRKLSFITYNDFIILNPFQLN